MELVFLLTGLVIGAVAVYLILWFRQSNNKGIDPGEWEQLKGELSQNEARSKYLEEQKEQVTEELNRARLRAEELLEQKTSLTTKNQHLEEKLAEQKEDMQNLQEHFKHEFKNIANELLETKSKKFTEQNEQNIGKILTPLQDKLKDFEKKVEDTHKEALERHASLKEQLTGLKELNQQMSKDALNLTRALKGDSKAQGNWGEIILERVLEKSGLTKGREYFVQESITTEEGKRLQPDVVIRLPEGKNVIIDSKVSLVDYERYSSAEEDDEMAAALKAHVSSIRRHVKGLSEKNYQNLYEIGSPDFVLLFVPIEPAFGLAVQHDPDLFNEAFEKNIVIVSTSTLLATLRTIASIWRQEYQNQNALEIARQGGALYDKLHGFVDDMLDVGKRIDTAKDSYSKAMNKLVDGRGNVIKRAETLRELGAKASKSLPEKLINRGKDSHEDHAKDDTEGLTQEEKDQLRLM